MAGFHIHVKGLEGVLRNIERFDAEIADKIDNELNIAARNVAEVAALMAPKRRGRLANSIEANTGTRFRKSVSVEALHGPYVEFGTGSGVFKGGYAFTSEQKRYARRYYVSGKGRMKSQAYLFPAFDREKTQLITRIKRIFFT